MKFKAHYLALVLVAGLLGGLLLAACGGGDDEEAEAPPAAEAPGGEVPVPTDAFADLESYRYSIRVAFGGEDLADQGLADVTLDLTGAFVAPDRNQVRIEGEVGGLNLQEETIIIGGRSWVRSGDTWREGEATFDTADLSPQAFFAGLDVEKLQVITPTEETVNGVDTLRYSIDEADIEQLQALTQVFGDDDASEDLPEDLSLDLWLTKDAGVAVKMVLTARDKSDGSEVEVEMSMDITDVDDPTIEIEPPD